MRILLARPVAVARPTSPIAPVALNVPEPSAMPTTWTVIFEEMAPADGAAATAAATTSAGTSSRLTTPTVHVRGNGEPLRRRGALGSYAASDGRGRPARTRLHARERHRRGGDA